MGKQVNCEGMALEACAVKQEGEDGPKSLTRV